MWHHFPTKTCFEIVEIFRLILEIGSLSQIIINKGKVTGFIETKKFNLTYRPVVMGI